jgi:chromosome segregation ATPase
MKLDGRRAAACLMCLVLASPSLAGAQTNAAAPDAKVEEAASEENRLSRREEEIQQQLRQLAQEQQDLQQQILESHRAQQDLQSASEEKDEEIAGLRRRLAEAEKQVQDLREQLARVLGSRPEYAEIKTRLDGAFSRRSEILRQENALSEELVRVQVRLREIRSLPPSETGSGAP